jgi:ABC-type sugar transport system ATPase subunit
VAPVDVSLLAVDGLSKRFGGLQAVKDLSFAVEERGVVGLIGPNGAGKTTVFGLVSGFIAADAGDIRFRGRSIVGLKPHEIAARGLVRTFQIVRPFPRLTVLRNVVVGAFVRHSRRADAEARARAVLDEVGLAAKAATAAGSLTLAERKRLELARPRDGAGAAPPRRGDGGAERDGDGTDRRSRPRHQRARRRHPAHRARDARGDVALATHRRHRSRGADR